MILGFITGAIIAIIAGIFLIRYLIRKYFKG